MLPLQLGDVPNTFADIGDLEKQFDFRPSVSVKKGVENFAIWYKEYYGL